MRTLNRIYAWLFGYFWLPCKICGRGYGGHEWNDWRESIKSPNEPSKGIGVCSHCRGLAVIINLLPLETRKEIWTKLFENPSLLTKEETK